MIVVFCSIVNEWKDGKEVRVPKFVHIRFVEDAPKANLDLYVKEQQELLSEWSGTEVKFYGASSLSKNQELDFEEYLKSVRPSGGLHWYELEEVRERLHKVCKHNLETYKPFWGWISFLA